MNPRMPPLPEAAAWKVAASYFDHHDSIPPGLLPPIDEPAPLFTADQLLSAQRAAWNAAMEAAAEACEEKADAEENIGPLFPRGKFQGALDCASAIRSLKEPE